MVKIYDIKNYRDTTQLENSDDVKSSHEAEIILFTGVRYERLCDHAATAENIEHFIEVPHHANIRRNIVGRTLKKV